MRLCPNLPIPPQTQHKETLESIQSFGQGVVDVGFGVWTLWLWVPVLFTGFSSRAWLSSLSVSASPPVKRVPVSPSRQVLKEQYGV